MRATVTPAAVVARQRERRRVAEVALQPLAHAVQAEAFAIARRAGRCECSRLGRCCALRASPDPAVRAHDHVDAARAARLRHAVLHRVLEQRLQQHRRNQRRRRRRDPNRSCRSAAGRSAPARRRGRRARTSAPDRAAPIRNPIAAACSGRPRRAARPLRRRGAGSVWISDAIALSALNRKCGLICARSAFSSDLLDCSRSSWAS